ncbi:class I SAM-dependent methyltransferase [Microbacterium sp. A93]|uniref:class I SAM-dependent methyltransferase n=1 Tax=Microbacterium sp. A93 TaxID=3450716 RepID=UPI003F428101
MREWAGKGEAYAASYAALCAGTHDALVARLGPARERRLLDVGSGTGALAAHLSAAGWNVTGCEPEETMRVVAGRQHPTLALVEGALPALPFADAEFDAVTANFVLNHVDDPRVAAREMARVAAPDAVLATTIWIVSPSWFWLSVCERAGLAPAAGNRLPPERDFERTASGFGRMLSEGGWHRIKVAELTWSWRATIDQLWASAEGGVASAGAFYQSLIVADRVQFRRAFDQLCAEHVVDEAVALEHTAAVAVGRPG